MTQLLTGWSRIETRAPGLGRTKMSRPDQVVPTGPAHAVLEGETSAICGASVVHLGGPWPAGLGARCRDCMRNATANPTPLGE